MAREKVIRPLGLMTRPNKYGQYDAGALSSCRNVCMRDKGVITSMPAPQSYRLNILGAGYTIRRFFSGLASLLALGDNAGAWAANWVTSATNPAVTLTPPSYFTPATFSVAKLQACKARDRYFVVSDSSPLVLDSEGDTTVRAAGFPAPSLSSDFGTVANAVSFLTGNIACWCAVWRRKQSDGYETVSEPSAAIRYYNNSGGALDLTFTWTIGQPGYDVAAGDYLELYRTKQVASPADPGLTFYLAASHVVTAGEVAANTVTVKDTTPDASLSQELYSNPGRPVPAIIGVGGSYVNTPPGQSTDTWQFKGQTFYAVAALASYLKFRIGSYWGALNSTAERTTGIGTRITNGTTGIGSNVITAVVTMTGIVVGQSLVSAGVFPAGTIVTAVNTGASTITVNNNATAAGVNAHKFEDVWEVGGVRCKAGNGFDLVFALSFLTSGVTLQADQSIYIGALNAGPTLDATSIANGITFVLRMPRSYDGALTLRVTNGQNYAPALNEITAAVQNGDTDPRGNRLQWSKPQQPEHVPPQQELEYGSGTHYRGISTNDCVWLFASDGLWRKSGEQDSYRVDIKDSKLILAGRDAVGLLGSTTYAYTERGFVSIDSAGTIKEIARDIIGDLIPGAAYADTWNTFITCDEAHREVWLSFRSGGSTTHYVYSEISQGFVDVIDSEWSALEYAPYLRALVVGLVDATPDVYRFRPDTDLVRMAGATLDYQPLTGGGDPFTSKQWTDVEMIFEGVSSADLSITPRFDGVASAPDVPGLINTKETRARAGVPRSAAMANVLRPGFTLQSVGGTGNAWSFRGLSARYSGVNEESGRR